MIAHRLIVAGFLAVACPGLAWAQHSGSADDQMACTPDVYRLCSAQIPDEDSIVACLKKNKQSLSPACGAVFARPQLPSKPKQNDEEDDD